VVIVHRSVLQACIYYIIYMQEMLHRPTNLRVRADTFGRRALAVRGMVKTATSQNGDKPKRLQVQSKCINLLSSTLDLFSELLIKFQLIHM